MTQREQAKHSHKQSHKRCFLRRIMKQIWQIQQRLCQLFKLYFAGISNKLEMTILMCQESPRGLIFKETIDSQWKYSVFGHYCYTNFRKHDVNIFRENRKSLNKLRLYNAYRNTRMILIFSSFNNWGLIP